MHPSSGATAACLWPLHPSHHLTSEPTVLLQEWQEQPLPLKQHALWQLLSTRKQQHCQQGPPEGWHVQDTLNIASLGVSTCMCNTDV